MRNSGTLYDIMINNSDLEDKGVTFINDHDEEVCLSYKDLYDRALDMLFVLQSEGIEAGSSLIIYIDHNEMFLPLFWACILGKIVPIPVSVGNFAEYGKKLIKIWMAADMPRIALQGKSFEQLSDMAERVPDLLPSEHANRLRKAALKLDSYAYQGRRGMTEKPLETDIALVQFSSGSTGDPKGILLTHQNILTNISAMVRLWEFTEQDVTLNWMPLTHDMGLIGVHILSSYLRIRQYIMPSKLFINKPLLWMAKVHEHRVTGIYSPNFGYKYFLSFYSREKDYRWDLSCIRYITNGAEPISVDLCEQFMAALAKYQLDPTAMKAIYGLGEASASVTLTPIGEKYRHVIINRQNLNLGDKVELLTQKTDQDILLADVGRPVENCEVKICGEDGEEYPDYRIGRVLIRGTNVTIGYMKGSLRGPEDWLDTGDLGFLYAGRLVITGRMKEILCINGQNYYPYDIERVAESFEAFKIWRSAACSYFDEQAQSEKILFFVVYRRALKSFIPIAADLRLYIYNKTGLYIEKIIPVKDIPVTTSGKIQRYKLAEQFLNGEFNGILSEIENLEEPISLRAEKGSLSWYEEMTAFVLRNILKRASIGADDDIFELGVNSMLLTKVYDEISRRCAGQISVSDLFVHKSIRQLAQYLYQQNLRSRLYTFELEADDAGQENHELVLIFEQEVYRKAAKLSGQLSVGLDTVVLGFVLKYFYHTFRQEPFTFQLLHRINRFTFLEVDFREGKTLPELLPRIQAQKDSQPGISYHELKSQKISRGSRTIIPLFEVVEKGAMNLTLSSMFDLIIKFYHTNDQIKLLFVHNNKLSNRQAAELAEQIYTALRQGLL